MTSAVDPITLEVVVEGLIAIVREMRATVIRASYSSVIWELDDFSCAIFEARTVWSTPRRPRRCGHVWPPRDTEWPSFADERDPYAGVKGRHRLFRIAPALAATLALQYGDLVELRGRHPAPLRGWVSLDTAPGAIGLDAFGRAVLGTETGATVEVRRLEMPLIPGGMTGSAGG